MDHSKGNLSIGERDDYSNLLIDGRIFDGTCQIGQTKGINHAADAQRLVTCWNEHDTLKATAALFDEAINLLHTVAIRDKAANCQFCEINSQCPYGSVLECLREKAKDLISKVEKLK